MRAEVKIPKGWRLLRSKETLCEGDRVFHTYWGHSWHWTELSSLAKGMANVFGIVIRRVKPRRKP